MEQSNNLDKDPLNVDLGDPPEEWSKWFAYMGLKLVIYVAKDPWGFFATVLMILTPLLGLSAFCAFKLAKEVQRQEEEKKLRDKRNAAIAKKQKHVKSE
ncbi:hypothetical protein FBUS_08617 [Fasciolopsis buskii]|uniref:Small integral membrane protein 15 n=1 Tax=Fasciolopsis buskii TaxID=27845 RepID=A0A8E0S3B9_9TREM|nr:hypothetical protein FBUS_08617 [Fasciolopsis buski]